MGFFFVCVCLFAFFAKKETLLKVNIKKNIGKYLKDIIKFGLTSEGELCGASSCYTTLLLYC